MISPPRGIKKQVFGGVLFCLGAITALLARIIGFELDVFYIGISIVGAWLFVYGAMQRSRHESEERNEDPMAGARDCTM